MITREVTVQNPTGLHARPASELIVLCKKFACSVKLEAGTKVCDAKSIFSVMKCAIRQGTPVKIVCDGADEAEAAEAVAAYIENLTE